MHALRRGAEGDEVSELQESLNRLGFELDVDGVFGERTQHAVIALQVIFGEHSDGIVGPATRALIEQQVEAGWNVKAARTACR
jgi:peptidoglycan hydrolase-like protein with peptidoglycan-binding domain